MLFIFCRVAMMMMIIVCACMVGTTAASGNAAGDASPMRPNVLVFLMDDVGLGDLEPYGGAYDTPVMQEIAEGGMLFGNAHSPSSLCGPSRYSMLTGNNPLRGGREAGTWKMSMPCGLPEDKSSIATPMRNAQYHTGFWGKMHIGGCKLGEYGFDYVRGLPHGIQREKSSNEAPGFFDGKLERVSATDMGFTKSKFNVAEVPEAMSRDAVKWIAEHNRQNRDLPEKEKKPFFMYYSSVLAHIPTHVPDSFWGKPLPERYVHETRTVHMRRDLAGSDEPYSFPEDSRLDRKSTKGHVLKEQMRIGPDEVSHIIPLMDMELGVLVDALKTRRLWKNTLIFVTSDNGGAPYRAKEFASGHFAMQGVSRAKGMNWEGGTSVPFLAHWPGKIAAGSENLDGLINGIDIVATLADLVGFDFSHQAAMDSRSLWPLLDGTLQHNRHQLVTYDPPNLRAFRRWLGNHQYAYLHTQPETRNGVLVPQNDFLYDLTSDPKQARDLKHVAGYAAIRAWLAYEITQWEEEKSPRNAGNAAKYFPQQKLGLNSVEPRTCQTLEDNFPCNDNSNATDIDVCVNKQCVGIATRPRGICDVKGSSFFRKLLDWQSSFQICMDACLSAGDLCTAFRVHVPMKASEATSDNLHTCELLSSKGADASALPTGFESASSLLDSGGTVVCYELLRDASSVDLSHTEEDRKRDVSLRQVSVRDPKSTWFELPITFIEGPEKFAQTGEYGTLAVVDLDGDGYEDVCTGSWRLSHSAQRAGRVDIHFGAATAGALVEFTSVVGGTEPYSRFGANVERAGDCDGDGFSDLLVSAPLMSNGVGGVWVLFAGPAWRCKEDCMWGNGDVSVTHPSLSRSVRLVQHKPVHELEFSSDTYFGSVIASIQNFNGDGFDDFVIATPFTPNSEVFVYLGGPYSRDHWEPDFTFFARDSTDKRMFGRYGQRYGALKVGGVGDVNSDGFSDFAVTTADDNIQLVFGRPGRRAVFGSIETTILHMTALYAGDILLHSPLDPKVSLPYNYDIAALGDVDGDSHDDFAITWNQGNAETGSGIVVFGTEEQEKWPGEVLQALDCGKPRSPSGEAGKCRFHYRCAQVPFMENSHEFSAPQVVFSSDLNAIVLADSGSSDAMRSEPGLESSKQGTRFLWSGKIQLLRPDVRADTGVVVLRTESSYGDQWTKEANTMFGESLAMANHFLVIGAPGAGKRNSGGFYEVILNEKAREGRPLPQRQGMKQLEQFDAVLLSVSFIVGIILFFRLFGRSER